MDELTDDLQHFYENFGLTVYAAQALEIDALNLLLCLRKMDALLSPPGDLKALERGLRRKTLGSLVRQISAEVAFDEHSQTLLLHALEERNYLLHHFVTDHAAEVMIPEGRGRLADKFDRSREVFKKAQAICQGLCWKILKALGIGPEVIKQELAKLLDDARRDLASG